jgi:hypothetical protein
MSYHFRPLAGCPNIGVLDDGTRVVVAQFLTPSRAKRGALARVRKEEMLLLDLLRSEAAQPEWYPER